MAGETNFFDPNIILNKQKKRSLDKQQRINQQQEQDFLSSVASNKRPEFDANYARTALPNSLENSAKWLSRYQTSPLDDVVSSESQAVADRFNSINKALQSISVSQNARNIDFDRLLQRQGQESDFGLNLLNSYGGLKRTLSGREGLSRLSEIARTAQVERINKEYQRKIDSLKEQAEVEKQRGNTAGWASIMGVIGTLVGSLVGGPIGGVAGGTAGNAVGRNL